MTGHGNDGQSKVERAKRASHFLRGTIAATLAGDAPGFGHDDLQALKFHGVYQQTDRDARGALRALGTGTGHWFMVRVKIPAGLLTGAQYLALDDLARRFSHDRSLRLTTRQGVQFHGVLKERLRETIRGIDAALLSTLAACGDLERNVMAPPALGGGPGAEVARELARRIARELCPRTGAYHEIWLDGERVVAGDAGGRRQAAGNGDAGAGSGDTGTAGGNGGTAAGGDPGTAAGGDPGTAAGGDPGTAAGEDAGASAGEEPFYGPRYLPRKFKTAVAVPEDNSVEVHSQDVGIVALVDDGVLTGANVLVGGGLGLTHRKESTFARLATPLGHVGPDHVVGLVRAVAAVFRDHGNRADRRHARLKYLIEEWGMERFRQEVRSSVDFEIGPWRKMPELRVPDHLGPHLQGDGHVAYGVPVPNGRVIDTASVRLKTALRTLVEALDPGIVLTPRQDLVLTGLAEEQVETVETVLTSYGVPLPGDLSGVRRLAVACPALPTCGLALAESERVMPRVLEELESALRQLGLHDEPLTVRMTGCPNGCARPYTADIGFVGRRPGEYDIFVGGTLRGDRLADRYAAEVPIDELVPTLAPLLRDWQRQRRDGEALGDFHHRRHGDGEARTLLTGAEVPLLWT